MGDLPFPDNDSGDKTLTRQDFGYKLFMDFLLEDYLYASALEQPQYQKSLEEHLRQGTVVAMMAAAIIRKNPELKIHDRVPAEIIEILNDLKMRPPQEAALETPEDPPEDDGDQLYQDLEMFLFEPSGLGAEKIKFFQDNFKEEAADYELMISLSAQILIEREKAGKPTAIAADLPRSTIATIENTRDREQAKSRLNPDPNPDQGDADQSPPQP